MFVEDPGGSVGPTAAAKKMRKNISIKQQNKWNKKKEQQQQRQRQTNKEQQGKKKWTTSNTEEGKTNYVSRIVIQQGLLNFIRYFV